MNKRKEEKKKKKKERESRENRSILYKSGSTDPSLINKTKLRKKLISSNYIVSQFSLLSILSKIPADHFFFFYILEWTRKN
jgi:hypothetical protein